MTNAIGTGDVVGAPVVDRMHTRALEQRSVRKGFVDSATIAELGPTHALLRTDDRVSTRWTDWSERAPFDPPAATSGAYRVDLVSDDVVRIRYQPASADVAGWRSPMIVGGYAAPGNPTVEQVGETVELRTDALTVRVNLAPLSVAISTPQRGEVCRIGGREKNAWSLWDTYSTGVAHTVDGDHHIATECFALRPGEAVYGFGERFCRLDKVGQTLDLNMVEATGTTTPRAYKNIPFFWTTHGYGVFAHTSARATAWVGSRGAADVQLALEDGHLDFFVFVGDPKTILDRYTTLTGKAAMPPRWTFGLWQSKISYRSADEVLDVVRRYRAAAIPVDVVHIDTHWFSDDWRCDLEFDPQRFGDPAGFLAELDTLGVKVCLWQLPYIPEGSALFDELEAAGGFVQHPDGGTYDIRICYTPGFTGRVGCIDFTNPAAVEIYRRWLGKLFALGVRAIKADFGEQAPLDGVYHDGTPGHLAHNLYPLLYNQTVAEATHDATGEWVIWARSAWAGSQRYPLHWGGDSSPNWDNLGPQIAGGLSLGACGFTFWSQDIGGFLGNTGGDLLVRWLQAGLFLSHVRIHGSGIRELDAFGPDVLEHARAALNLRYRLLPTIIGEAGRSAAAGLPLARPLVIEFPDDPTTWPISDQWLLGEHLLVAPILDPSGRRRVYLPTGRWADWWTGEVLSGNRWLNVDAPLDRVPLWIRDGGAIALGPVRQHVDDGRTDTLLVRALAPAGGRATQGVFDVDGLLVPWRWSDGRLRVGESAAAVEVELLGEH